MFYAQAGNLAKIQLQLAGHDASSKAVEDLVKEKAAMDASWQASQDMSSSFCYAFQANPSSCLAAVFII